MNTIQCVPIDSTNLLSEVLLPEGSQILCVRYIHFHDHIIFTGDLDRKKEKRVFVYGVLGSRFEPIHDHDFVYVDTTVDEDNKIWCIYELTKKEKEQNVRPTKRR